MSPAKTLAMVQTGVRKLEPRDLPIPEIDDESALLRVEACGICGSDYEQYEGMLRTPMPVIPGHEPLGVIEKIGDAAARRWSVDVGDRVAVETMLSCRFCSECLGGRYHLCRERRIYSYIPLAEEPGLWGAYAQYMFVHRNSVVHKIDRALAASTAVMFNPLGAGFRWGVEMPRTGPGDTVLVLGPGQRGLACVIACREAGADQILVTGLAADAKKLALAREFGADHAIDVENENALARVRELTGGQGADVVIDVSSYSTAPVAQALDFVRPGGREGVQGDPRLRLRQDRDEGDLAPGRDRRHLERLPQRDPAARVPQIPGRKNAYPRLCAARRGARDPHACARDPRRRVDPLVSAAGERLVR
jgi:threonine dehydrogenase-like Zn-dependent dehydrogenase